MALKIRLRQQGRNNRAFYRVVVADVRSPRDGRYVETVGWYNPIASGKDQTLFIKQDRIQYWLDNGAQFTENTASIIAQTAPELVNQRTEKLVAKRAKALAKRKARKKAAAA